MNRRHGRTFCNIHFWLKISGHKTIKISITIPTGLWGSGVQSQHFQSNLVPSNVLFPPHLYKAALALHPDQGNLPQKWKFLILSCDSCMRNALGVEVGRGGVIIPPDLIAKGNPCISSPLTSQRRRRPAAGGCEIGERVTKRGVSVACRGRGRAVTAMCGDRNRGFDWAAKDGRESFHHLSETFNRVKRGVLLQKQLGLIHILNTSSHTHKHTHRAEHTQLSQDHKLTTLPSQDD